MVLHEAIARANRAGRRGLILYTVPGYPNPSAYDEVVDLMEQEECVSILETTIPVSAGFSDHANDVIREAHRAAVIGLKAAAPRARPGGKPRLAVLYRATVEEHGPAGALELLRGKASGLILEWEERENGRHYREASRGAGLELVECVGPWMSGEEIRNLLGPTAARPLVYLMSAARTGAELFGAEAIAGCVREIRRHRQEAKIAAGFGISGPEQIVALRRVAGLDALIIGTAWLKATAAGAKVTRDFLAQVGEVL